MISVVVPAHDEESSIVGCLTALVDGALPGALEVVVVANGCTDTTADLARTVDGPIRVLEIDEASKVAALNAGEALVTGFPRVYLDGDIVIGWADVQRLAAALDEPGTVLVAPERRWITDGRPWIVRSYTRFLEHLPTVQGTVTGTGVLAINAEGRARFDTFPRVTADDLFLEAQARPNERRRVVGTSSAVETPRTLKALIHRRTRVERGKKELRELGLLGAGASSVSVMEVVIRRPALAVHLPAFLGVTLAVRLRARLSRDTAWERDTSTR